MQQVVLAQEFAPHTPLNGSLLALADDNALDRLGVSSAGEHKLGGQWFAAPFGTEHGFRCHLPHKQQSHILPMRIRIIRCREMLGVGFQHTGGCCHWGNPFLVVYTIYQFSFIQISQFVFLLAGF